MTTITIEKPTLILRTYVGYHRDASLYGPMFLRGLIRYAPPTYICVVDGKPEIFLGDELVPAEELWTEEALKAWKKTFTPSPANAP